MPGSRAAADRAAGRLRQWHGRDGRGRRELRAAGNKANDYLIDRKLQKTKSYTGIKGVSEQDAAVQDSQARSRPHPRASWPTDLGIMHFRKLVMDAARALATGHGADPCAPGPLRGALRRLRDQQGQGAIKRHGPSVLARDGLCRAAGGHCGGVTAC